MQLDVKPADSGRLEAPIEHGHLNVLSFSEAVKIRLSSLLWLFIGGSQTDFKASHRL